MTAVRLGASGFVLCRWLCLKCITNTADIPRYIHEYDCSLGEQIEKDECKEGAESGTEQKKNGCNE
ncbi:hypothetical protein LBMAG57_35790 [Verrucomicrobiota bacterium]|nr:hypothetical protein LBMAG57_35790 [Verrucomicrobiota bacterium]